MTRGSLSFKKVSGEIQLKLRNGHYESTLNLKNITKKIVFYSHSICQRTLKISRNNTIYYIRERKIQGKQIVKDYVCKIDTAVDNLPLRHRHSDHERGHVVYKEYHQRIHQASLIRSLNDSL